MTLFNPPVRALPGVEFMRVYDIVARTRLYAQVYNGVAIIAILIVAINTIPI